VDASDPSGAEPTVKSLQRELREQRKAVRRLSDYLLLSLDQLDEAVGSRRDIPSDVSTWLAKLANALDQENDRVRFFTLGVDFRKDNKPRAVAAIRKRLNLPARAEASDGR
jgi:hypothetical protein